jgi:hypothetical protein
MIHESDKATILNSSFDASGIKFHDRSTTLQTLTTDREISYAEDGTASIHYDGEILPLEAALKRFAYDNRAHVDGRTLPKEGVGTARPGTLSKAAMTLQEKIAFIKEHGADAFSRIASKSYDTQPVDTRQDWMRLSRTEKVRRLAADPDAFTKLPNATSDQPKGGYINHAALEREKAIKGK